MTASEFASIRQSLKLTQAQFAVKLGVAPNTVARWERGERRILQVTEMAVRHLVQEHIREMARIQDRACKRRKRKVKV